MSSHISSFLAPALACGVGLAAAWLGLRKWQAGKALVAIALLVPAVGGIGFAIFTVAPTQSSQPSAGVRVVRAWGQGPATPPLTFRLPVGCESPLLVVVPEGSPVLEVPASGTGAAVAWSGTTTNAAPIRCEHGPGVPALVTVTGHVTVKPHPSWTAVVSIVVDAMQAPDGKAVEFTAPEPIARPHVPM